MSFSSGTLRFRGTDVGRWDVEFYQDVSFVEQECQSWRKAKNRTGYTRTDGA